MLEHVSSATGNLMDETNNSDLDHIMLVFIYKMLFFLNDIVVMVAVVAAVVVPTRFQWKVIVNIHGPQFSKWPPLFEGCCVADMPPKHVDIIAEIKQRLQNDHSMLIFKSRGANFPKCEGQILLLGSCDAKHN